MNFLLLLSYSFLCLVSDSSGQFQSNSRNIFAALNNPGVSRAISNFGGEALSSSGNRNQQDASSFTSFLLFTRSSGERYTNIYPYDTESLFGNGFESSRKTKILFHGWNNDGISGAMGQLRRAYLAAEDVNIISVHWPQMCRQAYPLAVSSAGHVGRYAAQLMDWLVAEVGVDRTSIHLLGFSLGAHTAGIAGENVKLTTVHRITGLDPAGPMFSSNNPTGRLDASDADFVDVIHTDGGGLGYRNSMGTVDFFPNGGFAPQPGCGQGIGGGSHGRAPEYFIESLTSDGFIATRCDGWQSFDRGWCSSESKVVMGEHVDLSAQGDYYLYTNSRRPYAAW